MADLRDQLRRIETTEPPDLWTGIEGRARERRPQVDTNITSIDAFRTRGSERRRRITAGLVAAAVCVLGAVVAWQALRPVATPIPHPTGLPAGWVRCTNEVLGYSIGFPGAWHTTDVFNGEPDPANACQWFSPTPFGPDGNVVLEGWGYPLEIGIRGPFDQQLEQVLEPEVARILEQEELVIDGHRAVRLEYETLIDVVAETGLHYEYLIELDAETSLIVHTTETRGIEGDYEENRAVVDLAVDTLRFTSP
jgi:hypothetical protein